MGLRQKSAYIANTKPRARCPSLQKHGSTGEAEADRSDEFKVILCCTANLECIRSFLKK